MLIGYCLARAADTAIDKSKEWVKLAEGAGIKEGVSEIVIRYISNTADLGRERDPNADVRRELQDRIQRLEAFTKFAETVVGDLRARLEALPPPRGDDEKTSEEEILLSTVPPLH